MGIESSPSVTKIGVNYTSFPKYMTRRERWIFGLLVGCLGVLLLSLLIVLLLSKFSIGTSNYKKSGDYIASIGVCYDPGILEGTIAQQRKCVVKDFRIIQTAGYRVIRTYSACFHASANTNASYASVCKEVGGGLKVLLSVPSVDWETTVPHIKKNPTEIYGVILGNGDVKDAGSWAQAKVIVEAADKLRHSLLPHTPRVGTAQMANLMRCAYIPGTENCGSCPQGCTDAYQLLLDKLDFVGANVYPFTPEGGYAVSSSNNTYNIEAVNAQIRPLREIMKTKFMVTESGMPHTGSCQSGDGVMQMYSRITQNLLVKELKSLQIELDIPLMVFMAFDVPTKPDIALCNSSGIGGSGEKFFGVLQTEGNSRCERGDSMSTVADRGDRQFHNRIVRANGGCIPCRAAR
jgi:hypothetical protein